jgi:hypothetical protein
VTLAQARAQLWRPLKFGDEKQIEAIRFIDAVDDYAEHLYGTCPDCWFWIDCVYGTAIDPDVESEAWKIARRKTTAGGLNAGCRIFS